MKTNDMPLKPTQTDDLQTDENLKRIDDLETFRKGFEGKELDAKICNSIKESVSIQEEIKKLSWKSAKEKIVWIILGGVGVIFVDLLIRAIPNILSSIKQ